MILIAFIEINIVAKTGADLNHLVWNILKSELIESYTINDELRWLEAIYNIGRFNIINFL